jgi:hypothetical protein
VTVNGILGHERALQQVANLNGGTRASGTPGFQASLNYVRGRLDAAGYTTTVQQFDFPFFEELADPQVSPTPTEHETATFQFSGSGDVTGSSCRPRTTRARRGRRRAHQAQAARPGTSRQRGRSPYDGDGDPTGTAGPPGSAQIEDLLNQFYSGQGMATDPTAFDGRSDSGPFIAAGILFTGAEGIKTAAQAATYGGTAASRTTTATTRPATR